MKKIIYLFALFLLAVSILIIFGCNMNTSESHDRSIVNKQQEIYQKVQPIHIYDYSIPRDIYQQIYDATTTRVVATYSIIESMTGVTRYQCPSMGYAIPADSQLTNPLQPVYSDYHDSGIIEQAEPNGMFSSKNTDGTWVMCVDLKSSEIYPVYSEHKVTTFPFIVEKNDKGEWVRADNKPLAFKIEIRREDGKAKQSLPIAK